MMRICSNGEGGASGKRGWPVPAAMSFFCLALVAWVSGCTTVRESTPHRTATEQLLLSTAADSALETMTFSWLAGRKVYVQDRYFESYDKEYVVGLIRERLSVSGALLVGTTDKGDVIVEIRSGALSIDNADTLLGIPAMMVPIPFAGSIQTPEISLYKSSRADSIAKVALFAYERVSGQYLQSAGPMLGRAYLHLYKLLFVTWRRTDVPELSPPSKQKSSQFEEVHDPQAEDH